MISPLKHDNANQKITRLIHKYNKSEIISSRDIQDDQKIRQIKKDQPNKKDVKFEVKNLINSKQLKTEITTDRKHGSRSQNKLNIKKGLHENQEHNAKLLQRKKQQILEEESKLKDFKVQNKKSKQINSKNHLRTISLRTNDIIKQKKAKLLQKRAAKQQIQLQISEKKQYKSPSHTRNKQKQYKQIKKIKQQNITDGHVIIQKQDFLNTKTKSKTSFVNQYSKKLLSRTNLHEKTFLQRLQIYSQEKSLSATKRDSNKYNHNNRSPLPRNIKNYQKYNKIRPQNDWLSKSNKKIKLLNDQEIPQKKSISIFIKKEELQQKNSLSKSSKHKKNQSFDANKLQLERMIQQEKKYIKQALQQNRNELIKFLSDLLDKQKNSHNSLSQSTKNAIISKNINDEQKVLQK